MKAVAILDEDCNILGLGQNEEEARSEAVKTILGDRSATEVVVTHAVEDMWGVLVSRALADQVRKHGGDIDKHQTVIDRRAVFVTTEEYSAIVAIVAAEGHP